MSAYFDQKAKEVRELRGQSPNGDPVRAWTRRFVEDITIACEYDRSGPLAFPTDLRDQAYMIILRCSPEHWPCGTPGYGVDYEFDAQGIELLWRMVESMHDLFHTAAHAEWPGRDNPRSAVQAMDGKMEERCAELVATNPALNLAPPTQGEAEQE